MHHWQWKTTDTRVHCMQPTTITGSIGVIYGKLNIAGGLEQASSTV